MVLFAGEMAFDFAGAVWLKKPFKALRIDEKLKVVPDLFVDRVLELSVLIEASKVCVVVDTPLSTLERSLLLTFPVKNLA